MAGNVHGTCVVCAKSRRLAGRGLCTRCHTAARLGGTLDNYSTLPGATLPPSIPNRLAAGETPEEIIASGRSAESVWRHQRRINEAHIDWVVVERLIVGGHWRDLGATRAECYEVARIVGASHYKRLGISGTNGARIVKVDR